MSAEDKAGPGPVTVIGAGSWGTALAIHMANAGSEVTLWGNEPEHMERLQKERCNQQFIPDIPFPETLKIQPSLELALKSASWILLAIPSYVFRSFLAKASVFIDKDTAVTWASKGLEEGTGKLLHQVVKEELPQCSKFVVISGPTFAREVALGLPTAITVASESEELANKISHCLHHGNFRAYTSNDMVGVELGGALKNVLAIASGAADGLGFGANARAALITRGLAELMRLGVVMGAHRETFMGLAGMGDLVLTCTDNQSRNRRMGLKLAEGLSKEEIKQQIGQEIEGVRTAREAMRLAEKYNVELPIIEQVYKVLYENLSPQEAVRQLLERKPGSEIVHDQH
ncbi:MAG: NAD(P)-dependent glycerol-3-phosphate dehydrogenase [Gammaproteobacteria bacterium]|nr:NAD(P)-dependent glycerol-3-phosphate dehydrogenase [Gammaproteobacteria bacterium]